MGGSNIRRTMPLFPMGIVMQLTDLTARQIRYYEEHELIHPARSDGNRRLFSLNDIDKLLEIKDLLDEGMNMAGIKKFMNVKPTKEQKSEAKEDEKARRALSDEELRKLLRNEFLLQGRYQKGIRPGDMSRFFH